MTEFRNTEQETGKFRLRITVAGIFVIVCFALLLSRFIWLQIMQHAHFSAQAEDNRISVAPIVPNRGLIYDRNGVVLARNYSAYTLEITPSKLNKNLDAVIDELSGLIDIQTKDRKRFRKLLDESKSFESLPIRTLLSDEEVARFSAQRYRFPGVEIRARLFRHYPLGDAASHVIGYIGRISLRDRSKLEELNLTNNSGDAAYDPRQDLNNYKGTDYIGKIGLEQSYETELHGLTGFEEVEVSAGGRAIRTLSKTQATPGNNLILSLDIKLQDLIEQLYGDRRGALVAIEPETGDILAFVSKPTFNPNLFVDGIDTENWKALNESPDRPLFNRPLKGSYPPASTYKPFMALAALETGKRTPGQAIYDPGFFQFGNHTFRDDKAGGHGMVDLYKSVVHSCDTYYYLLARDMGVNAIHDFMKPFGFGQITGIDIEGEARGVLPSTEWKRKAFRKPEMQKWYDGETISIGIGQGYNNFTILQIAHATATLANNGTVMKPHLVKAVENALTRERRLTVPKESYRIPLRQENIEAVKRSLVGVNLEGTSAGSFRGTSYQAAGKTGTAQVYSLKGAKYDAAIINERLRDHALYMAFAPADKPRIALAIIVENAGFGSRSAAPIARQVFDYYLDGKWPDELSGMLPITERHASDTPAVPPPPPIATSLATTPPVAGLDAVASAPGTAAVAAGPEQPTATTPKPFNPERAQAEALGRLGTARTPRAHDSARVPPHTSPQGKSR